MATELCSDKNFSEQESLDWFQFIAENNSYSLLHVWHKQTIIGQLEFTIDPDKKTGYVNLFYLMPEYRGMGLGQLIHDYVLTQFIASQCTSAMLRYIPGNDTAEQFYGRNGWLKSAEVDAKHGQLMCKDLTVVKSSTLK